MGGYYNAQTFEAIARNVIKKYDPSLLSNAKASEVADYFEQNRKEQRRQSEKDRRHKADKECTEDFIEDFMMDKPVDFVDGLIRRLEVQKLRMAITELPEVQKRRLVAYFFEGLTYQQIAERENVNLNAVYKSVNLAIEFLKKYFNSRV